MNNFTKLIASYLVKPKMKLLDWIDLDILPYNDFRNTIYRNSLSRNPNAIHLLEQNLDKIEWHYLSSNPNAIHLLEQNIDKIYWKFLSLNLNPKAPHLLEQNIDKIDWHNLSYN